MLFEGILAGLFISYVASTAATLMRMVEQEVHD